MNGNCNDNYAASRYPLYAAALSALRRRDAIGANQSTVNCLCRHAMWGVPTLAAESEKRKAKSD